MKYSLESETKQQNFVSNLKLLIFQCTKTHSITELEI